MANPNPFEVLEAAWAKARENKPKAAVKSKDNVVAKAGKFSVVRYETDKGGWGKKLPKPITKVCLKVECVGQTGVPYLAMVPVAAVKECMGNPADFAKALLLLAKAVTELAATSDD